MPRDSIYAYNLLGPTYFISNSGTLILFMQLFAISNEVPQE